MLNLVHIGGTEGGEEYSFRISFYEGYVFGDLFSLKGCGELGRVLFLSFVSTVVGTEGG